MWSPISAGDGRPSHHTFLTDSGAFLLTGVLGTSIAMHLVDVNTNILYICTGTWNITNPGAAGPPLVPATADFTPSIDDLSVGYLGRAGLYRSYPVVTLASGPVPMDSQLLSVLSQP